MFLNWQKKYLTFLLASFIPLFPTKSEGQIMKPCTPSIEPAITVTVLNAQTKAPIKADIVVKDGKFQEVLTVYGATASGQTIYGGAFERPGIYTLRVSRKGYITNTIVGIDVSKNECHVLTRHVNIKLKPVTKTRKRN